MERFNNGDSCWKSDIVTGNKTWIYQHDPKTKCQSSVWVFPDEEPPTKVKRPRSVQKKMVATFLSSGHLATVVLEDQRTVTAKWYTEVCLFQVFTKIQEKRPRKDCEEFCPTMTMPLPTQPMQQLRFWKRRQLN